MPYRDTGKHSVDLDLVKHLGKVFLLLTHRRKGTRKVIIGNMADLGSDIIATKNMLRAQNKGVDCS